MNRNILSKNKKTIKKIVITLSILAISIVAIFYLTKIVNLINEYGFQNLLSVYNKKARLIYFLICFLQPIVLPLPEPVTIMGGSSVLGSLNGASIGFLGTFLGIIVMYFISMHARKSVINKFVDEKKLEKFNKFIKKNELLVILALFILPILPDEVICVGAGLASISAYKFIGIAAIAKLITSVSLSYSLKLIKFNIWTIAILILLVLTVLILNKYKNSIKEKIYRR